MIHYQPLDFDVLQPSFKQTTISQVFATRKGPSCLANTGAICNSNSVSGKVFQHRESIQLGGLSKEQQFRSRHDLPQVVNSTNISLLGSHSNRRHENLHSEATPSNFGDGNLTTSFFPISNFESNISDKKPHHKIDISYDIIFPSVWPKSNLPSPTEIRPSQPVIESVMVCVEVGRNPYYDQPFGTGRTSKNNGMVEHQHPGIWILHMANPQK